MKKRILITCDYFPPAVKAGGPLRTIEAMAIALSAHHEVLVLTRGYDFQSTDSFCNLPMDQVVARDNYKVYYASNGNLWWKQIMLFLRFSPKHLILNSFFSPKFSFFWLIIGTLSKAQVHCAPRGELMPEALQVKAFRKRFFLSLTKYLWRKAKFIFSSEMERLEAVQLLSLNRSQTCILPEMRTELLTSTESTQKTSDSLNLFYLARIHPIKNLLLAIEILKQIPQIGLDIYGSWNDDTEREYWEKCQAMIVDNNLSDRIKYRGFLNPENVSKVILAHHALFLPSSSENFGHSILETLALGRPVLIGDRTPWSQVNNWGAGAAISLADQKKFVNTLKIWLKWNQAEFDLACQGARDFSYREYCPEVLNKTFQNFLLTFN